MIRVLHIDDEAPIRLLARVNLEWEAGWEVIEAADGRTGIPLAKREQPDLILLNVNLPPAPELADRGCGGLADRGGAG